MDSLPDAKTVLHTVGVLVVVAVIVPFAIAAAPQIAGADHSYVVVSGSMSPQIDAGDMVVIRAVPTDSIRVGDVITFTSAGVGRTTHRVVEVVDRGNGHYFRTKGDANENPDPGLVDPSQVVGRVWFHVPYVGYVILFANSKSGILALVVVPAVLLVVSELWTLFSAVRRTDDDDVESVTPVEEPTPMEED